MKSFPDITKWYINNANMRGMFYFCVFMDIPEFGDLSKWKNFSKNLNYIFYYCDRVHNNDSCLKIISNKFHIGIKTIDVWNILQLQHF